MTDQKDLHFAAVLVVLADEFDFDGAAADAADFKFAERAVARRLARLIIFPAHEKSGGIHAHSLPNRMDNGCPMHAGIDETGFPITVFYLYCCPEMGRGCEKVKF